MAQPLDPVTPAVPPRPPLRHRVPGQGPARRDDREDAAETPLDNGQATRAERGEKSGPEKPRNPDDEDGHLIDDYA